MNDKWMKDIARLGKNYTKKAPEGLLDDVKREMQARKLLPASIPTSAGLPLWRKLSAAAAVAALLGIGTAGYMWIDSHSQVAAPTDGSRHTAAATTAQADGTAVAAHAPALQGADNVLSAGRPALAPKEQRHQAPATAVQTADDVLAANTALDEPRTAHEEAAPDVPQGSNPDDQPLATPTHANHTAHAGYTASRPTTPQQAEQGGWQISAYYGGAMTRNRTGSIEPTFIPALSTPAGHITMQNLPRSADRHYTTKYHHRQPIKVGLSVQYGLNSKWSLYTGLTYSYLSSDITDEGYTTTLTHQQLHYVGLPLSVGYSIWQNRHINVYAKMGAEAEKLVSGKAATRYLSETLPEERHTLTDNKLLWSTHAAAGVEYKAIPRMSLYAEPGMRYRFDNGSLIRSAYTDKRVGFSLNIGARIRVK